jgi:hypothetical protein
MTIYRIKKVKKRPTTGLLTVHNNVLPCCSSLYNIRQFLIKNWKAPLCAEYSPVPLRGSVYERKSEPRTHILIYSYSPGICQKI